MSLVIKTGTELLGLNITLMVPILYSSPLSLYTMETKSLPMCNFLALQLGSVSLLGISVAMWNMTENNSGITLKITM